MKRRRVQKGKLNSTSLVARERSSDFKYLEQVVTIQFPVRSGMEFIQRNMGNVLRYRLVEAVRGETVGVVRSIEIHHASGGDTTHIRGERVLPNGEPASFFVPNHLVEVRAVVEGAAKESRQIGHQDELVLVVPVRGYLRYLPGIFQGEGPVTSRRLLTSRDSALQRWGGGLPAQQGIEDEVNADPMRRFLFLFQHMMARTSEQIDRISDLTDPLLCDGEFLPWLASWVGFELDESLPVHQQRELVRRAIRLMRTRGTRGGIEEMVRVLTAAPVRVRERVRPQPVALGTAMLTGGRTAVERYRNGEPSGSFLVEPSTRRSTSFFQLFLEPRTRFRDRFGERAAQVIHRIIDVVSQERPTHVAFTIQFDTRA